LAGREGRTGANFWIPENFIPNRILPIIFGLEHEAVGALDQFVRRRGRMKVDGRSHAQGDRPALREENVHQSGMKPLDCQRNNLLPRFRHEYREFIPSQPSDDIGGAGIFLEIDGQ
jgi:hypothetical protein